MDDLVKELRSNLKNLQLAFKNQQYQQVRDEVHATGRSYISKFELNFN